MGLDDHLTPAHRVSTIRVSGDTEEIQEISPIYKGQDNPHTFPQSTDPVSTVMLKVQMLIYQVPVVAYFEPIDFTNKLVLKSSSDVAHIS